MLIVIPTINIHLTYLHVVRSMLNVDETFNMAQALCTSALAASYVNRLNVFFLINYKKPRHLLDVSADIILYREV